MGLQGNDIKKLFMKNYQYVIVGVLLVSLGAILFALSGSRNDGGNDPATGETTENTAVSVGNAESAIEVPDDPFEVNAYPDVNSLINKYFKASAEGDMDKLLSISEGMDENEQIRTELKSKVTEDYSNITCYTKKGPEPGSYLVFVEYEIKFDQIDTLAPGLTAIYVRPDASGELKVSSGSFNHEKLEYFKAISAQSDVVELLTAVDEKYRNTAESDKNLASFLEALPTALDVQMSEAIANKKMDESQGDDQSESEQGEGAEVLEAKIKENVNVRSSASTDTNDNKLGKLFTGDKVKVLEKGDEWSKIDFQGNEAYVKTEYLGFAGDESSSDSNSSASSDGTIGKVIVKERVNIRKSATSDGAKLGTADAGQEFGLIMDQADGWCRIKYNGEVAYVKSEFVTIKK